MTDSLEKSNQVYSNQELNLQALANLKFRIPLIIALKTRHPRIPKLTNSNFLIQKIPRSRRSDEAETSRSQEGSGCSADPRVRQPHDGSLQAHYDARDLLLLIRRGRWQTLVDAGNAGVRVAGVRGYVGENLSFFSKKCRENFPL
jgi:hypothetical protein